MQKNRTFVSICIKLFEWKSVRKGQTRQERERERKSSKWAWNIVCNTTDGVLGAVVVYICVHFLLGFVLLRKCHPFMWHVSSHKNARQYFCVCTGTFLLPSIKYSENFSMPSSIIIVLNFGDEQMHLTQQ